MLGTFFGHCHEDAENMLWTFYENVRDMIGKYYADMRRGLKCLQTIFQESNFHKYIRGKISD